MKNARMKTLFRIVCFVSLNLFSLIALAQDGLNKRPNVNINANCNGLFEWLPQGYTANPSQKFPLLICVLGLGSNGPGTDPSLDLLFTGGGYPVDQQRGPSPSWVDAYTVNSQTFRFVIITPQFIQPLNEHIPTPQELNDVINYSISHYHVDTSRIYLIGSSQGAGTVWDYVGYSAAYARRIAAAIPFAGVSFPFQEKADIMKYNGVKIWAMQNSRDDAVPPSFSIDYVKFYNNPPTPAIPAKLTLFDAAGHQCWFLPLTRNYTEGGLNVYQWLLQYKTNPTTAFAGEDQEITLPTSTASLASSGTAPDGTAQSFSWTKISGPSGGNLSSPNSATTSVSGLALGTYVYRLTINGSNGSVASDDVALIVNPGAQRIEAENFIACTQPIGTFIPNNDSLFINPTTEGVNGHVLDGINWNNWADYNVTVPTAGTYRFRFHAGSGPGGTQFQVKNASGTVLGTVQMYGTGYDRFMNLYSDIPLNAGSQTIRIQNSSTAFPANNWFLNWFEVIDGPLSSSVVLPVNFTLFNAQCANGGVNLQWKTAGELSSKDFSIEKSINGRDWESLATIPAAGNTGVEQTYTYTDHSSSGTYYRIVQQDLNGRKTLSPIIRSSCVEKNNFGVYPNPVSDRTYVHINLQQSSKIDLSVLDSKGAVVQHMVQSLPAGNSQIPVDLNALPAGTYTLYAKWNNETHSVKLVKKN